MNRLEILYGDEVKKIAFTVRKVSLRGEKIILKGPRHSGKTYLILDLLSSRKKESGFSTLLMFLDYFRGNSIITAIPIIIKPMIRWRSSGNY